jgi:hypothetical protein
LRHVKEDHVASRTKVAEHALMGKGQDAVELLRIQPQQKQLRPACCADAGYEQVRFQLFATAMGDHFGNPQIFATESIPRLSANQQYCCAR